MTLRDEDIITTGPTATTTEPADTDGTDSPLGTDADGTDTLGTDADGTDSTGIDADGQDR